VKNTCGRYGLDPDCFSARSLRKVGITHMGALGSSAEHMLARGCYAPNSRTMSQIYDQSVGLGPLRASGTQTDGHGCQALDTSKETVTVRTA
jgi:hypothetical protein